jgi:hypothetical protein
MQQQQAASQRCCSRGLQELLQQRQGLGAVQLVSSSRRSSSGGDRGASSEAYGLRRVDRHVRSVDRLQPCYYGTVRQ